MTTSTFSLMLRMMLYWSTLSIASCAIEVDFRVTPSVVEPLVTKNVTIQCLVKERADYYNPNAGYYYDVYGNYRPQTNPPPTNNDKSSITIIRILKNLQNKWQAIVQISNVAPDLVHKLDASIVNTSGIISSDQILNSHLKASWDVAASDTFGTYRCDVISFDSSQNAILTKSAELPIGNTLNALDLLRLLKHDMTDIRQRVDQQKQDQSADRNMIESLKSTFQKAEEKTKGNVTELETQVSEQGKVLRAEIEKIEHKIDDMENEITHKIDEVGSKVDTALESGFLMLWPRGSYGLLQPESGCSESGMTKWETGWIKQHTESTDRNKDDISAESHLQKPALQREGGNNFVTQHFCIKTDETALGPDWPNGSYCINKKGNCPAMFTEGSIEWDEENDAKLQTHDGSLPDVIFNDNDDTTIKYCCRRDGPVDVPVYLPNSHPFYLYRYGGKCQQVHIMNVTEEFLLFDTENTANNDKFGDVHPDGTIKNVRLQLCYYSRI